MAAPITFQAQEFLDARDSGTTACDLTSLSTMELVRLQDIADHSQVDDLSVDGRDDEGYLVVTIDSRLNGIYETLFVARDGRVAEAMLNQPIYHASFMALVKWAGENR